MKTLFTSESVTCGHPDKVCDQIADHILDALLSQDPNSRVACEVTAITDKVHIFGEITTKAKVDYEQVARETIKAIGYSEPKRGFDYKTCEIIVDLHTQSPDIALGVDGLDTGAGDQGMMFGYACIETPDFMPLPIHLAHKLTKRLEEVRVNGTLPYLLPDGKAQVTVEYENDKPISVTTVVVSAQHKENVDIEKLRTDIIDEVVKKAIPSKYLTKKTVYHINPTGRFVIGGPAGDSGLTGRKIVVDTYGGSACDGGGSTAGKDATKVDRSGAYLARYIAKNIVKAGFAKKCEVQLSYAIGVSEPVSLFLDFYGTETIEPRIIKRLIKRDIDMRPRAIINKFKLDTPIYGQISCYGQFGHNAKDCLWEKTDLAKKWQKEMEK